MFALFSSPSYVDPEFGELKRSRGMWRGQIMLMDQQYPFILNGARKSPDPNAIAAAKFALKSYGQWRQIIERALFEHNEPYAEAVAAGELPSPERRFGIQQAVDVWKHVQIDYVAVDVLAGKLTIEIAYRTDWDEEHIVAARFQDGHFIELCGSVLRP